MKTILIPTDFSETSKNASQFGVDFAVANGITKIVFYHHYQTKVVYTPTGALDEYASVEPHRDKSIEDLNDFIDSLGEIPKGIETEMYQGAPTVHEGVEEISKIVNADLIIMGIKGGGVFKETIFGSHTLRIAKKLETPVLVVPATAKYVKFSKITLLSDLKDVVESTPVDKIDQILFQKDLKLTILNVVFKEKQAKAEHPEKEKLEFLLKKFSPEFHYKLSDHFTDGILDYTHDHDVDVLVIIPKHHNIIEAIFSGHTEKLAFHTKVPLLIIH